MFRKGVLVLGMGSVLAIASHAGLDLAYLSTATVKTGQPWAQIDTKVDTLDINVEIDRGVVTTKATIEYTPGKGSVQSYRCVQPVCAKDSANCAQKCEYVVEVSDMVLDSLETSGWFNLADNAAITDMYLWVGDVRVKAALQERTLASAQYENIVKRRKDPALIETWGSGSYSLRIFPNQTGQKRKIEIEFVQGMESGGDLFSAVLPLMHSLATHFTAGVYDAANLPKKSIAVVNLTATAVDGANYSLQWPGLGSGQIGMSPLRLRAVNVEELKEGKVSSAARAGAGKASPWIAEKGGAAYFGFRTLLDRKTLSLEAEPRERDVILDVDAADTASPARARKLALLALKAYAQAPYVGNLALSDGKGNLDYVFPEPVEMDAANLAKAYAALKSWKPSADADAKTALEAFAKKRPAGSERAVAFLINNDPYSYYQYPVNYNPDSMSEEAVKVRQFEDGKRKFVDGLAATLKGANAMLFGYWNDFYLGQAAQATGGFSLGGIYGWIYAPYAYRGGVVLDAGGAIVNPVDQWYLPPLFGPGRPDAYGITDLKVTPAGHAVSDLVVLQDYLPYYYGYGRVDIMMLAKRASASGLAKSATSPVIGYPGRPDSLGLRISGRYAGTGSTSFSVTGLWGGLRFTRDLAVDLPVSFGAGAAGASLWAYQQVEAWARDQDKDDVAAMQKLGKEFHVVNRQMSLLALEPDMPLWSELPTKPGTSGNGAVPVTANDMKSGQFAQSGMNLDGASLEEILNGTLAAIGPAAPALPGNGNLSLRPGRGSLEIAWSLPASAQKARFRILDAYGRVVADLAATRNAGDFTATWSGHGRTGVYFLVAKAGSASLTRKFILAP